MRNQIKKTISAVLVTVMLCFVIAGFSPYSAAAATGSEVKLLHAESYSYDQQSTILGRLAGSIEVENMGYHKKVNVVWRKNGGAWTTSAATYAAPTEGNFEAWEFNIEAGGFSLYSNMNEIEFYITYNVKGKNYIDNNGGNNYRIGGANEPRIIMNKPAVKMAASVWTGYPITVTPAFTSDNHFVGGVFVKNLAPDKDVKIVYTTDNWTTVQTASAYYTEPVYNSGGSIELWNFKVPVSPAVTKVEMAVLYIVNGIQYWDTHYNNRNYIIQR